MVNVALLHHSNHDLANVIGTSAIIRRGSDTCASDIGWIVLAFAVGSGFAADCQHGDFGTWLEKFKKDAAA